MPTSISGDTGVDQVTLAALAAKFTGSANQSLTSDGYQKLPGGLILQWGVVPSVGSGTVTVSFPISFSSSVFQVNATRQQAVGGDSGGGSTAAPQVVTISLDSAVINPCVNNNDKSGIFWFAIGV